MLRTLYEIPFGLNLKLQLRHFSIMIIIFCTLLSLE